MFSSQKILPATPQNIPQVNNKFSINSQTHDHTHTFEDDIESDSGRYSGGFVENARDSDSFRTRTALENHYPHASYMEQTRRLSTVVNLPLAGYVSTDLFDTTQSVLKVPIRGMRCKALHTELSRQINKRFLRARPEQASLQEIGLQYLVDNPHANCRYFHQKAYVSRGWRLALNLQGHTWVTLVMCVLGYFGDLAYCFICAIKYGAGLFAWVQIPLALFGLVSFTLSAYEENSVNGKIKDFRKINYR